MLDNLIISFDKALNVLFTPQYSRRAYPDDLVKQPEDLTMDEKARSIRILRINYCGEICAQGLYQGQRLFIGQGKLDAVLEQAAIEEEEHLAWLERRLLHLDGRKSVLNSLFYLGSITFGVIASASGPGYNMGFLYETEKQVEEHLAKHLELLPEKDVKTSAILQQMQLDESIHATHALELGAQDLPKVVTLAMRLFSKAMTTTTAII